MSPGCEHCYAETFSHRLGLDIWGPTKPRRFFGDKHWNEPLKWDRARTEGGDKHLVFCASMADVFEELPELDKWRDRLFALIERTPNLTWQLLTKRPENMMRMSPASWQTACPKNVWAMTTAEDQHWYDFRVPSLLKVPAVVRGISYEPALGPIDFRPKCQSCSGLGRIYGPDWGRKSSPWPCYECSSVGRMKRMTGIDWVIPGGESSNSARIFDLAWARSAVKQCEEYGVACFMKQLGRKPIINQATGGDIIEVLKLKCGHSIANQVAALHFKDKKGGDWNEWPDDLRVREMPEPWLGERK